MFKEVSRVPGDGGQEDGFDRYPDSLQRQNQVPGLSVHLVTGK